MNTVNDVSKEIKEGKPWKEILTKYESNLNADSGRFELSNIPVADRTAFSEKLVTTPFSPNKDNNLVFAYIIKLYPEGAQRNFEDAKGLVINDYQTKLEESWIASLKKKYPIKINDAVWKDVLAKGK
jgi:peptidyl-prolyl cis-trans isomerase SurA